MFARTPVLLTLAFVSFVLAEGNLTDFLQALSSSGLDQFANATGSLNGTDTGKQVLARVPRGDEIVFAPTDDAWGGTHINDGAVLADIISYHIVSGNFANQTATYPNVTIGRTLLNDSSLVMLEGNKSQVLVWSKSANGSLFVTNQGSNITVVNATSYDNTSILAINSVLTPPPNISAVLDNPSYNLVLTADFLRSTPLLNGSSILDVLSSTHGITLFTPNDAAVQAAQSSLASLAKNPAALQNVISNHAINGTSVYSTEISNGSNFTSAGGQHFAFSVNSTGLFVSVGGSNQVRVVEADVLTSNGVIQIVNGVMLDPNSNPAAASSAFASETSAAAHTTETGLVTSTPIPTSGETAKGGANYWRLGVLVVMVAGIGQFV